MRPSTPQRHGAPPVNPHRATHPPAHPPANRPPVHAPPHHDTHAGAKPHVYLTDYQRLLMKMRDQYDLLPWIEVIPGLLPYQSPLLTKSTLTVTPSYGVVWEHMPFMAWDVTYPSAAGVVGDLSSGAFTTLWSTGANIAQVNQSLGFITTDDAHGSPSDEWVQHPGGVYLKNTAPKSWEQWQEILQLVAEPALGGSALSGFGYLYAALRGYRFYDKGTIFPKQKTREEYLAEGHRLEKFTYTAQVQVTFLPGTQTGGPATYVNRPGQLGSYQLVFNSPKATDADFLCSRIRIRPQTLPSTDLYPFIDTVGVGLQMTGTPALGLQGATPNPANPANPSPNQLFPWRMALGAELNFNATAPATVVGEPIIVQQLRSQWDLAIPLTIPYNSRWNMLAQPLVSYATGYAPGGSFNPNMTMEFCLDGELILPKE